MQMRLIPPSRRENTLLTVGFNLRNEARYLREEARHFAQQGKITVRSHAERAPPHPVGMGK
jgi:hypothetical protein